MKVGVFPYPEIQKKYENRGNPCKTFMPKSQVKGFPECLKQTRISILRLILVFLQNNKTVASVPCNFDH